MFAKGRRRVRERGRGRGKRERGRRSERRGVLEGGRKMNNSTSSTFCFVFQ